MPVESLQSGCCCSKQDLKKEAQRTNRFNTTTTTSNNSRPSSLTSCNHLESNSRLSNDYKMQDNNDVPCINIILKPIPDQKSEQKDKGIQIVEITAVKENSMKHNFIDSTISPSNFAKHKNETRSGSPRMNEKLDTKCVKIQTENGEYCRDISMQTETKDESIGENKTVQFRDDKIIKDNFDDRNLNSSAIKFSPKDNNSLRTNENRSVNLTECFDSTKTLYGSTLNSEDKMKGISYLETCMKKKNERDGDSEKLSERINRKIDKLSVESNNSPISFLHADTMSCNDTCKMIPTQAELVETYSDKADKSLGKSFPVTENTETLPSVLSNNSPIPKISIDTTEFESPAKNKSSKVTIETIFPESCVSSSLSNPTCCSEKNSTVEGSNFRSRNLTSKKESSENLLCARQDIEINRTTKCNKEEHKSTLTDKNLDKFNNSLGIGRNFSNNEAENFSELPIDGNLSSETKSKNNHSDDVKSIGTNLIRYRQTPEYEDAIDTRSDISLPKPITTSSALIASDLTRPEFIRMLTEIKEHTCNLEMQLSAMNETMKQKQANRTKTFGSSVKKHKENGKTIDESIRRTSEVSLIENGNYTQDSIGSSCCGPSDKISLSQNSYSKNKSEDNENCCEEFVSTSLKSHKKLKPSSRINRSDNPKEVIVYRDESNISLRKHKPKNKPVFKTKRSYLWNPYRNSDYKTRNQKQHSSIPSAESSAAPRIISELSVLETKIDVSCSPTNCCSVYEMIDQSNAQPSFFNSTPKKVSTKLCGTVEESGSKSDHELPKNLNTTPQSLDSNSSKHSNIKKNYSQDAKIEPVVEALDLSRDNVVPRSEFKSKKPKLRSRLGVKQVPSENQTKDYRKIIPSNSRISPSASRESFKESSPNESLKYSKTRGNFANRFSSQLRKLSPIPRLDRKPIHIKNSSDTFIRTENNSQACVVKQRLAEQAVPFSVNNSDRIDSEEEVHSMDYPESKSVREYNCDKLKNSSNGKKRKRKSDGRESIKFNKKPGFNNSVASEARDSEKNRQSSQYQEHSENNSITETISESLDGREQRDHVSEKFSQSNSKREDPKCTIRVTVSLDEETPSNERTK